MRHEDLMHAVCKERRWKPLFHYERMNDSFEKWHIAGVQASFNLFTGLDLGEPHDHPYKARSTILSEFGYIERVYALDGSTELRRRKKNDTFTLQPGHIHKIVELPGGHALTLFEQLGPKVWEPGFYQFREDGPYRRAWNESEFRRVA